MVKKEKKMIKQKKGKKAQVVVGKPRKAQVVVGKPRKAQVTVFIILALAIVIILILLLVGKDRIVSIVTTQDPVDQIRACVDEPMENALEVLTVQGGSLEPTNYYYYQGNKIEYLCYAEANYQKCVMQKPLLKQSIEKELEGYLQPRIKNCISAVKSSLQKKGYTVSSNPNPVVNVQLVPGNILVDIQSDLKLTKDTTESYKSVKTDYSSNLYELTMITGSILNWEARYGDSETMNYMIYYPNIKAEKKKQGDGSTVYILTDRFTLDKFMFATRSVVIPPGLVGN